MENAPKRLLSILVKYSIRIITLLLAVSIISFALVCASPVDSVQQYILGLGSAVSPEQRAEIEDYWGVDEPPVERYISWLSEVVQGTLVNRRYIADQFRT